MDGNNAVTSSYNQFNGVSDRSLCVDESHESTG